MVLCWKRNWLNFTIALNKWKASIVDLLLQTKISSLQTLKYWTIRLSTAVMDLAKWSATVDRKSCTNIATVRFSMEPTLIQKQLNSWQPHLFSAKWISRSCAYARKIVNIQNVWTKGWEFENKISNLLTAIIEIFYILLILVLKWILNLVEMKFLRSFQKIRLSLFSSPQIILEYLLLKSLRRFLQKAQQIMRPCLQAKIS